jgi:hypothetical protein
VTLAELLEVCTSLKHHVVSSLHLESSQIDAEIESRQLSLTVSQVVPLTVFSEDKVMSQSMYYDKQWHLQRPPRLLAHTTFPLE